MRLFSSVPGESGDFFNVGGGGVFDNAGNQFMGIIDEVAVWDSALSEAQILAQFRSAFGIGACDFDGNGTCDVADLDLQMNAIADNVPAPADDGGPERGPSQFDLNNDGLVDNLDRDEWLAMAATENGLSAPYQLGDSNLDLKVDVADLNNLGLAWRSDNNNWSDGNFAGAGVDAADLNIIALAWQTSHPDAPAAAAVPEPSSVALLLLGLLAGSGYLRKNG